MNWVDGSYYKGDWDKGVEQGEGEMKIDGKVKYGIFENGCLVKHLEK